MRLRTASLVCELRGSIELGGLPMIFPMRFPNANFKMSDMKKKLRSVTAYEGILEEE
jgi:hypothetical protein